jgi:hypothetical protein
MSPPPKPAARITKVVPTPAKNMPAFDAMTASPVMKMNAEISTYVPGRIGNGVARRNLVTFLTFKIGQ